MRGAAQPELEQRALAELRLGDGREHAGGDVPGAGLAGVDHHGAQAAPGGAPRAREADRPAADDGDVGVGPALMPLVAIPSLRRYDPDQVRRSAARAALSARSRAPVPLDRRPMRTGTSGPRPASAGGCPRERIAGARLYLVCDARPREFLAAALRGGVDVVQLRDKALGDEELVTAAREFRAAADARGALFVLNDRPDLVAACGADGVHVGQDDGSPAARASVGPDAIVGRSTHAPDQGDAARPTPMSTTSRSGPCTRRRPSRAAAAGLDYVEYAAATRGQAVVRDRRHRRRQRGEVVARGASGGRRPGDHGGRRSGAPRRALRAALSGPPWASVAARRRPTAPGAGAAPARGYARSPRSADEAARAGARAARARRAPARGHDRGGARGALAVANLVLYLAGWDVRGQGPELGGALAFCAVLGLAAIGMWRAPTGR